MFMMAVTVMVMAAVRRSGNLLLTVQFLDPVAAHFNLVRVAADIVQQVLVGDEQFLSQQNWGKWIVQSTGLAPQISHKTIV